MDNKTIEGKLKEYGESLRQSAERVRRLQEEGKRIQSQIIQAVDENKIVQGGIRGLQELLNDQNAGEAKTALPPENDAGAGDNAQPGGEPEEAKADVPGQ